MPTTRPSSRQLALTLCIASSIGAALPAAASDWADQVSAERIGADWSALQQAALDNGGSRSAGSAGYEAAARYIETQLATAGITVHREHFKYRNGSSFNLIAEVPGNSGPDAPVIMLGAHLDSVSRSPGADDNGSGSAAVLEIARLAARRPQAATLRFAWWGAEELGLLGSSAYITQLAGNPRQRQALRAYLNADMLGSPNYIFGIYDPDHPGSPASPPQTRTIHQSIDDAFDRAGKPRISIAPDLASDQLSFSNCGIATGGVASIPGIRNKTPEEQALFGGEAGKRHSPNYHMPSDRIEQASAYAQLTLTQALADAVATLATQPPAATTAKRCNPRAAQRAWLRAQKVTP